LKKDNKASNEKYVGKVIRFGGIVSEIEGDSALLLTLNTGLEDFSAKCGFNKSEFSKANKIESGDSIVVQGSCDGVDIPSDEMSLFGDKSISFSRCALFDTK